MGDPWLRRWPYDENEDPTDVLCGIVVLTFLAFVCTVVLSALMWLTSYETVGVVADRIDIPLVAIGHGRRSTTNVRIVYRNSSGQETDLSRDYQKGRAPQIGDNVRLLVNDWWIGRQAHADSAADFIKAPLFFGALFALSLVILVSKVGSHGLRLAFLPAGTMSMVQDTLRYVTSRKAVRQGFRSRVFLDALFSMAGKLAATDGGITAAELRRFYDSVHGELKLSPEEESFARRKFDEAASSRYSFQEYAALCARLYMRSPEMLNTIHQILREFAEADGNISPGEEDLLKAAADEFFGGNRYEERETTFKRQNFKRASTSHRSSSDGAQDIPGPSDPYRILGVMRSMTNQEIKRAYRKLALKLHPDRLRAQGLPEGLRTRAEEKFRTMQQAYEQICAERGIA